MILDEIVSFATDDKVRITVLLRKCLVLAHVLKNDRLKMWVQHELNGYDDDADLPPYRRVSADAKGNFAGPFGSALNGWPIPAIALEEGHRKFAETVMLNQAIAAYEDAAKVPNEGTLTLHWPNALTLYYRQRIPNNKGMVLIDAWQEIPKSTIIELLDTVRNRVLSLALELKDEVGVDEKELNHFSIEAPEAVEKTVVQQIFGGTVYVASDNASIQVQNTALTPGDWSELANALSAAGISKGQVEELSKAISADKSTMGGKVLAWIKQQAPHVVSGGVKIGTTVGQAVLTEYLKQHFGIH